MFKQSNTTNLLVCKLNTDGQVFRRQALLIGSLLSQIGAPQPCLLVLLIPRLACTTTTTLMSKCPTAGAAR